MSPGGWEAAVVREAWEPLAYRLHIYRRRERDGVTEVLDGTQEDGRMVFRHVAEGETWDRAGIPIPAEMVEPIRDAFIKAAGPLPSSLELAAVRESLKLERERVDRVMGRLLDGATR